MADDLRNTSVSEQTSNRTAAFFRNKLDAYQAVRDLRSAGFAGDDIGLAVQDDDYSSDRGSTTTMQHTDAGEHDRTFWQEVKDFFTGNDADDDSDYRGSSMRDVGWDENRAAYYDRGIGSGGALVTVAVIAPRLSEARIILERHNGDLREAGFDANEFGNANLSGTETGMNAASESNLTRNLDSENVNDRQDFTDRDQRIQLRGEMLRTYKERVKRGEVRLRKEVVTENQTVDVPITREELVIERVQTSGTPNSTGEIGSDNEIRVPLEEERVRVDKQQVVNEEIRVGKRPVQDTKHITDNVRREELRVDKDGDVAVEGENITNPTRRKPAA